jgi:hypothetical protein
MPAMAFPWISLQDIVLKNSADLDLSDQRLAAG